jgi:aromatase
MSQLTTHEVEHAVEVLAPARDIYAVLADVTTWPLHFPPTIHAERLEQDGPNERIQLWATAGGEVKTWCSRRHLDPEAMRIEFRQDVSAPPVAEMGGTWIVTETGPGRSTVRLLHDFRPIEDTPQDWAWIEQAVDRNSRAELAALKTDLESALNAGPDRVISFEDSVRVVGSAADVYDFLNEAQLWRQRLPHVARVALAEDSPGIQVLEMDTRTKDGSQHTTRSVRVCFPGDRIVYKQITLPALMRVHTGHWRLEPGGDGTVLATSQHSVVINEATVEPVLGPGADVEQAAAFVRKALSANSSATLALARAYAEGRA